MKSRFKQMIGVGPATVKIVVLPESKTLALATTGLSPGHGVTVATAMKMLPEKRKVSGLTLIEVLAVLAILCVP